MGDTTTKLCEFCKSKPVCYPGARFCGAACTARYEAHEKPPESGTRMMEEPNGNVPR